MECLRIALTLRPAESANNVIVTFRQDPMCFRMAVHSISERRITGIDSQLKVRYWVLHGTLLEGIKSFDIDADDNFVFPNTMFESSRFTFASRSNDVDVEVYEP